MHAWIRSGLIFAAVLSLAAASAVAQDARPGAMLQPFPVGQTDTQQGGDAQTQNGMQQAPEAAPQGDAQPAMQASQPADTSAAPASASTTDNAAAADTDSVDDEAPAADTPDAAQVPPGDQAAQPAEPQVSGPKTPTDKIVDHFMELDTDGSQSVSMEEYVAMVQKRMEARFNAMDANHDGQITADEYREFWKSRMAHWYRLNR